MTSRARGFNSTPVACGVPQGCPFSPLAFLVFLEPLSRSISANPELTGVQIGNRQIKSSNFADDTITILKGYPQLAPMWRELREFCATSGSSLNISKSEGLRLGPLRRKPIPIAPELSTGDISG